MLASYDGAWRFQGASGNMVAVSGNSFGDFPDTNEDWVLTDSFNLVTNYNDVPLVCLCTIFRFFLTSIKVS